MFSHLSYLYSFSFLFLISFNSVVLIITKDFFVLYIFLIFQNLIILLLHLLKNFWLLYILLWYPNLDLRIHAIQIILTFERTFSNISWYDKICPEAFLHYLIFLKILILYIGGSDFFWWLNVFRLLNNCEYCEYYALFGLFYYLYSRIKWNLIKKLEFI